MIRVTGLWRHPIKGVGREALDAVTLSAGRTMPGDRVWAIVHDAARIEADHTGWARCANFLRGASARRLMAVTARTEHVAVVTLSHPDRDDLTVDLSDPAGAAQLLDWVRPLIPAERAQPSRLLATPDRGVTDSEAPTVSIMSEATLRAMSDKAGHELDAGRFRGNIWLDGDLAPWEEHDWIGRDITMGGARLHILGRIERCKSITANSLTGREDFDALRHLNAVWGHQDFGLHAEVISDGDVAIGDEVTS